MEINTLDKTKKKGTMGVWGRPFGRNSDKDLCEKNGLKVKHRLDDKKKSSGKDGGQLLHAEKNRQYRPET